MRTALLVVALAACRHTPPQVQPPGNVATTVPAIQIAPGAQLGWLALGTSRGAGASWLPVSAQIGALTLTDDPLPPRVTVVPATGTAEVLSVGDSMPFKYGCDNNELGVRPLSGARIAPGPAWILPPDAPKDWRPAALTITDAHRDPTHRTHVAGSLTVDVRRSAASRATLTITRDGTKLFDSVYERSEMDGADTANPIDLTETTPGIPEPIAAWSLSPAGPFLVVMLVPGYEGVTLQPYLAEDTGARVVEGMEIYLYQCAF